MSMLIKRCLFLFGVVALLSLLPLAQAQENFPSIFNNLEVITPSNLDRLVKLRDLPEIDSAANFMSDFWYATFNSNSTHLAGANGNGIWLWALATDTAPRLIYGVLCDCFFALRFHPTNPNHLATCNQSWDISNFDLLYQNDDYCSGFDIASSGQFSVRERPLRLTEVDSNVLIQYLPMQYGVNLEAVAEICQITISPDGDFFAYTATASRGTGDEFIVNIVSLNSGEVRTLPMLGHAARMGNCVYPFGDILFSLDSRFLYTNADGGVTSFEIATGKVKSLWVGCCLGQLNLTPDNQVLFSVRHSNDNDRLTAYAMNTMEELLLPEDIRNANVAINGDGKLLAAYTDVISIWGVPAIDAQ